MGCCGNKRAAAGVALRRRDAGATQRQAAKAPTTRRADVPVRYLGVRPVRVRGAATGRSYHASSTNPALAIDARDVAALIRTGLFRTS